jgi:phage tail-like protein
MPNNIEFPTATYRDDPYRNFRFRIKWGNRYVAGVSKVSGLSRTTQVITHRVGGDPGTPQRTPGQTEYHPITLERGVTHDPVFALWANKVWDYHNSTIGDRQGGAGSQDVSLNDFRKDIVLDVYNEAGQKVIAYNIYRCWPSEFAAGSELDGMGNAFVIETLVLQNEGWERDTSVAETTEPGFMLPDSPH